MMDKPFDAVRWMRQRREKADKEIRRLGWEEYGRRMLARLKNDPLWQRLKGRQVSSLSGVGQFVRGAKGH
jgi:hypothetical protein